MHTYFVLKTPEQFLPANLRYPNGFRLAAPIADLVMGYLESQILPTLNFTILFFKRYIDDIITAISHNEIQSTLHTFNSMHPKLQFTLEIENNKQISLLDILLIVQDNGTVIRDWYHKPTHTGRYLHYKSNHPKIHKINLIKNLKHRAPSLSRPQFHQKNLEHIFTELRSNDYPPTTLNRLLYYNNNNQSTQHKIRTCLPQCHKPTNSQNAYQQFSNLTTYPSLTNLLIQHFFTRHKIKPHALFTSNIVYKITCNNCRAGSIYLAACV